MKKRLSIKNDLLLLILLLVIGLLIPLGYQLFHRTAGNTVTITIDGDLWRTLFPPIPQLISPDAAVPTRCA